MDASVLQTTASPTTIDLLYSAREETADERSRCEEELVRRFAPLVRRLTARYVGLGSDTDDLVQVANLGLLKAIRGFDPEVGAFEPYAKATISGELKKHLRDHCWTIKPPRRVQELQSQIQRSTEELAQTDGSLPSTVDLADFMDASVSEVTEALTARSCYAPASLDEPLGQVGYRLADGLADSQCPYDEVDAHMALLQICTELSDDDRNLIRLRFYECLSQREIAEQIGVSQMQVSRRLASLLARLRSRAGVAAAG